MSRQYSPEEKYAALTRLVENRGNIILTAVQVGIPERTLRFWQRRQRIEGALPPHPPPAMRQLEELPPFANDLEAVNFMRHQMLDDLVEISRQLRQDFAYATPYQRMVIIPQLLDRLMKMDQLLKPYAHKEPITLHVIGSEGQEPMDDNNGRLEFVVMRDDNHYGAFRPFELMYEVTRERDMGYKIATILARFWRPVNGGEELEWQGTLTLTKETPRRDEIEDF